MLIIMLSTSWRKLTTKVADNMPAILSQQSETKNRADRRVNIGFTNFHQLRTKTLRLLDVKGGCLLIGDKRSALCS